MAGAQSPPGLVRSRPLVGVRTRRREAQGHGIPGSSPVQGRPMAPWATQLVHPREIARTGPMDPRALDLTPSRPSEGPE
jgi:hypothetical protein